MALVHYTGKNVFGVGLPGLQGDMVRFLPGINEIEDAKLQVIKLHPLFQSRIEKGLMQIMLENLGKDGKRSQEEVLKNIPQIFDTKLLKKLIETDGRDRVVRAATDQLEKIKNPSKAKAEEEKDEHFK